MTDTDRDQMVDQATAYVRSRFYPALPEAYGEYAVQAVEACTSGEPEARIGLDPDLPMHPRSAERHEDGTVTIAALRMVEVLRLEHMLDDEVF